MRHAFRLALPALVVAAVVVALSGRSASAQIVTGTQLTCSGSPYYGSSYYGPGGYYGQPSYAIPSYGSSYSSLYPTGGQISCTITAPVQLNPGDTLWIQPVSGALTGPLTCQGLTSDLSPTTPVTGGLPVILGGTGLAGNACGLQVTGTVIPANAPVGTVLVSLSSLPIGGTIQLQTLDCPVSSCGTGTVAAIAPPPPPPPAIASPVYGYVGTAQCSDPDDAAIYASFGVYNACSYGSSYGSFAYGQNGPCWQGNGQWTGDDDHHSDHHGDDDRDSGHHGRHRHGDDDNDGD
jgi:hypothetical protein